MTWQVTVTGVSGGSGTPGGADTQIQFNDGGSFGGDAGFTWDKATKSLTLTATATSTDVGHVIIGTTDLSVFQTYGQFPGAGNPSLGILGGTSEDYQFTVQIVSQWTEGLNIGMKAYPAQPAYWNLWCVPPSTPASAPQWDGLHLLGINYVQGDPTFDKNPIVFDENANTYFVEGSVYLVPSVFSAPNIKIGSAPTELKITADGVQTVIGLYSTSTSTSIDTYQFGTGGDNHFFYYNATQDITPFSIHTDAGSSGPSQFGLNANGAHVWWSNGKFAGLGSVDSALNRVSAGVIGVGTSVSVGDVTGALNLSLLKLASYTNSSPADGDLWFDGTNLKFRHGGVTTDIV